MASNIPPLKQLPLDRVVEKKANPLEAVLGAYDRHYEEAGERLKAAGIPTTPAGQLAHSQAIGKPRVTPPAGPSIAQIAKPKGFGLALPGATKT